MPGPLDFVLGGLAPLAAAAVAFAIGWYASRRAGIAWSAGVVAGYAVGAFALEARASGVAVAAQRLVRASESLEWLPLIALLGVVPAVAAALAGRRWVEYVLAAPLCVGAPLWLLLGKYRASQQLVEAGFAENAISRGAAAAVLAAIAVATLAIWVLWSAASSASLPKTRSLLAIIATVGAAMASVLTGSLVYGQAFGVLASALGGCAATAWLLGVAAGPEAARGPALLLFGGLLALAAVYSKLPPWQAAALAAAFVLPVGWLPGRRPAVQASVRSVLCVVPLAVVLWQAGATFAANERQEREQQTEEDEMYESYFD
jgi:hypothetical protein